MAQSLPRLRRDLDFFPSPSPEHPGLFLRDPFRYSDAMMVVPPLLVECLRCFDGIQTDLDLRAALVRLTGDLDTGQVADYLRQTLSQAGFLEDETFANMRDEKRQAFAARTVREPAHAGSAYPADPAALRETLAGWTENGASSLAAGSSWNGSLAGIAAPHVSPAGGWQSYRAAYGVLGPEHRQRTFVILATSHYGAPETFGLTRKNFCTPLGEAVTDTALVDRLAKRAANSVEMEDFCHSFEHTVELQLVFLQHALGADVRIVPVLCGAFAQSILEGGKPEDDDKVKAFCDALGEIADREGDRLFWVLGVDMAHMGARYTDRFAARAGEGRMEEVRQRDQERIGRINAADAAGFWDLVQQNKDDLKWCGASPFYTFLKSVPGLRGETLRYEQWNIDEQSVVSFAGMVFGR
ncbi:MAG: AmmeMemoRadiSam system protein B [Bryobacteraceae bacterium]